MVDNYASFGLSDQVAVVTGPSQGIGRALAIALAQAGAHLVLVEHPAFNQEALQKLAGEIQGIGRKALVALTDVTDVAQIRATAEKAKAAFGRIDVLINNAAWTATSPALEVTEEEWDRTVGTCLKGMFFLSQAIGRIMIGQGRGKIVNVGSTFAVTAFKDRSVYSITKAGVHQLTKALALEWAGRGVHVNGVAPCITETASRKNLFERPGYKEWITREKLPIGRWAQPEDMVGATLFLCSSLADMVVGHTIMVDGGWTIH
jgi:2-deoxy-D-gluconate 3-dehydrogenase